jgi:hypothetical protein
MKLELTRSDGRTSVAMITDDGIVSAGNSADAMMLRAIVANWDNPDFRFFFSSFSDAAALVRGPHIQPATSGRLEFQPTEGDH